MPFVACPRCGKQVRQQDPNCWNCGAGMRMGARDGPHALLEGRLQKCSKCGKEISRDAFTCPSCGDVKFETIGAFLIALAIAAGVFWWLFGDQILSIIRSP